MNGAEVGVEKFVDFFGVLLKMGSVTVFQILGEEELVAGFREGGFCDVQKSQLFLRAAALEAFDDIGRD